MLSPDPLEIHPEIRACAERNLEQAKFAFDKFMEAAEAAISSFEGQSKVAQDGAKEARKRVMNFTEQNVAIAFDYAQKLALAKDPLTLLALHGDFMSAQMRVLHEQATTVASRAAGYLLSAR